MLKWVVPFIWAALRVLAWVLQFVGCTMIIAIVLFGLWYLAGRLPE